MFLVSIMLVFRYIQFEHDEIHVQTECEADLALIHCWWIRINMGIAIANGKRMIADDIHLVA